MAIAWMRFGGAVGDFSLPTSLRTHMFFDRAEVKNALDNMEYKALTKASLLVRRNAQKSIRQMGMAKPILKEMSANPGMHLADIVKLPSTSERRRAVIIRRIREVQERPPSPAGSPPHTHVPYGMMLGFRRNIYNGYDTSTHSAVAGPSAKGDDPRLPQLHEFGGTRVLKAYVFQPRYPRYGKPIVQWMTNTKKPRDIWIPTGASRSVPYPPRPFMRPALTKSMPSFPKFFEGAFSAGVVGG